MPRVTSTSGCRSRLTGEERREEAQTGATARSLIEGPQSREWAVAVQVREAYLELMEDEP